MQVLVDGWANGRTINEIVQLLPKRDYKGVTRKAFRLGLPSRRTRKPYEGIDPNEDLLELDDNDPAWAYLDTNYTREEVEAVYAAQAKPKLHQSNCRNCGSFCVFESKFQRWCEPCRKEMNQIVDDGY